MVVFKSETKTTGALVAMVHLRRSGVLHVQLHVAAQVQSKKRPMVAVAVHSLCAPGCIWRAYTWGQASVHPHLGL